MIDIKLWGKAVGSLSWDESTGTALFDYERSFIRSGLDIAPIVMPTGNYKGTPYQFLEKSVEGKSPNVFGIIVMLCFCSIRNKSSL